jgi:hypothetical protein
VARRDVICILTLGKALYMHFTTAYAASRASVVPEIATDTRHSYSNASVSHLSHRRGLRDLLSHAKHKFHAQNEVSLGKDSALPV